MKKIILLLMFSAIMLIGQEKKTAIALIDVSENTTTSERVYVPPGYFIAGIEFPALETGTSAYSFLTGIDDKELWSDGSLVATTIKSGGDCVDIPAPSIVWGVEWFKIKLGTVQASDRLIVILFQRSTDKQ